MRSERPVFRHLGLTLLPGALCAVYGPNGSGKSSLLKIMAGLMKPAMGQVTYKNQPIAFNESYLKALCYIGHKNALFAEYTVLQNLEFWAGLHGTQILIPATMSHFDLSRYADYPCGRLSAGWQRRVALGRLLLSGARNWLLDEPFANLDEDGTIRLAAAMEARSEQGGIVVVAANNLSGLECNILLNINSFN